MSEKVIVVAKNKMYSGAWPTEFGAVQFQKGKAECTKEQAKVFTDRPEFSIKTESEKNEDGEPDIEKLIEAFQEDPEELHSAELYKIAQKMEIAGRTKMKKDELIAAIEKAEIENSGDDDNNKDEKGDEDA